LGGSPAASESRVGPFFRCAALVDTDQKDRGILKNRLSGRFFVGLKNRGKASNERRERDGAVKDSFIREEAIHRPRCGHVVGGGVRKEREEHTLLTEKSLDGDSVGDDIEGKRREGERYEIFERERNPISMRGETGVGIEREKKRSAFRLRNDVALADKKEEKERLRAGSERGGGAQRVSMSKEKGNGGKNVR